MSDRLLDRFLAQEDRIHAEDELWCQWGRHYAHASEMPNGKDTYMCRGCEARFEAVNAEVEQMFVEFGGEI